MAARPLPNAAPYWWEAAPPQRLSETPVAPRCDVAIVGAGYTGLAAAITLARAGRTVAVFDRDLPGAGASTRNGGMASGSIRPGLSEMTATFGAERAMGVLAEAKLAREDLARFIADEGIDCDFAITGRFTGADSPRAYDRLTRDADMLVAEFGIDARAVPRSEQHDYIGTDLYHGGPARTDIGGLHPAKLHAGMMRVARDAGAVIHGETGVTAVEPSGSRFTVTTARGATDAGAVIMATNGYTDRVDTWLRRRLVPVRSRIIATAPLSNNLMTQLMPKAMMLGDTRRLHYYFRSSPDGTRILYGGRDGALTGEGRHATQVLRQGLLQVFPILSDVEITHSWYGHVAMNRDMIPRIFTNQGASYAVGYCGSGVVWAPWAGRKAALQIIDPTAARSALDFRPPQAVPFYNGTPWFMPGVFAWLRLRDALDRVTIRRG